MLLITAADVRAIHDTGRDDAALAAFLSGAETFTDTRLLGKGLALAALKSVQQYVAAHLLYVTDVGVHEALSVEDVRETFTKSKQPGLRDSHFGRMAIMFDTTGTLAAVSELKPPAMLKLVGACEDATSSAAVGSPRQVIGGSSIVETEGAGTSYILQGAGATESTWKMPAHTGKRLLITRTVAPGPGCSITYTVRKNLVDTLMVVTLGASDTSGTSDGTEVAFADEDRISIKQVRSGDVAAGEDGWTYEYVA